MFEDLSKTLDEVFNPPELQPGYVDSSTDYIADETTRAYTEELDHLTAMVTHTAKPMALKWVLFENPFPTPTVKTAQVDTWWYSIVLKLNPSAVNETPSKAYSGSVYHI